MAIWPFKKDSPEPPKHEFGIGERVYLVDSKRWDNVNTRHLIGRNAVVVGAPIGSWHQFGKGAFWIPPDSYHLEVEGHGALWAPPDCMRRDKPDADPFAEPRHLSDDTPNKVVTWDSVPLFKPEKETIKS